MFEFAGQLTDLELSNEIIGTTDDDEIVVEVSYEPEERSSVFDLTEWYEDNVVNDED